MRKWLWLRLNSLRVWMVYKRYPARKINRISRICVYLTQKE